MKERPHCFVGYSQLLPDKGLSLTPTEKLELYSTTTTIHMIRISFLLSIIIVPGDS